MLPRWFRLAVVLEVAAAVALVVVGARLVGAGVHAASDALSWLPPARHAPAPSPLPDLGGVLPPPLPHAQHPAIAGIELLTPELFAKLNKQTGAFAEIQWSLLRDLMVLARGEATRLLDGVHVPASP